jgi:hypothetical protein
MRQVMFRLLIAVVAAVMISGVGVSASATGHRSTDYPSDVTNSELDLTIQDRSGSRVVTLTCDPDGGDHPRATEACTRLRAVDGDFTQLLSTGFCITLWEPVTVTASGVWRDRPIPDWQQTYSNICHLRDATYPIFEF